MGRKWWNKIKYKMTIDQKLDRILIGQARLFWLITQTPGVARYASDVVWFSQNKVNFGGADDAQTVKLVNGYLKDEPHIKTLILES